MACMTHVVIPGHGGHVRPQPGSSALSEEWGRVCLEPGGEVFSSSGAGWRVRSLVSWMQCPGQGSGSAWLLWELPDPQSRGSVSKSEPESC